MGIMVELCNCIHKASMRPKVRVSSDILADQVVDFRNVLFEFGFELRAKLRKGSDYETGGFVKTIEPIILLDEEEVLLHPV
jgi:hypothetical protein